MKMDSTQLSQRAFWIQTGGKSEVATGKSLGQFFTPRDVAASLVRWSLRSHSGRILDPSCGDGEFLVQHSHSVGVEADEKHASVARLRAGHALVHHADFFEWAQQTSERFDAVVGNPPFIRYQGFTGQIRERAIRVALRIGANLSRLTSSWAPFVAAAASLLKPGGRLVFVVPAEIGHAGYARPLLRALSNHFGRVQFIALREKIFPNLSEDAWILYASEFGSSTDTFDLTLQERFKPSKNPPPATRTIPLLALEQAQFRLRRFLLAPEVLSEYEALERSNDTKRLGEVADVGIGYVTGGNDFFHLRPSVAHKFGVPDLLLRPAVRRGKFLPETSILTEAHVRQWIAADSPVLLLDLAGCDKLPKGVKRYINQPEAEHVRQAYKCRSRRPWYAVPDVKVPDAFLSYMTGSRVSLIENDAGCVGTNSVHMVRMKNGYSMATLQRGWSRPLVELSCEIEGHPLGGGLLKLEPSEAKRILLPWRRIQNNKNTNALLCEGISTMQQWRHYAKPR